ncbi:MAG: hypothetical protein HC778_07640 [Chamaesiphon sp. CSU_1_12]|nr:hypothetical protein [Chamaesiphon sp. CSU_1_12]
MMESKSCAGTKCSNCKFFSPDGCRYGYCRLLNVTVEGKWSPCALSVAAFDRAASPLGNRAERQENWQI